MIPHALARYQKTAKATDELAGYAPFCRALIAPDVEVRYRLANGGKWWVDTDDEVMPQPGERYEWQQRQSDEEWSDIERFRAPGGKT